MLSSIEISSQIETFQKDGRLPIHDLYAAYNRLIEEFGWELSVVYLQEVQLPDCTSTQLPIIVLTTPQKGLALWILSGIHGEEPSGPNALAKNIEVIAHLGKQTPVVLFPLCNPAGYIRDWRYPNEHRDWKRGKSVSDASYLLASADDPTKSRITNIPSPESLAFTQKVLQLAKNYPPLLSIDHHEDEALAESYVYSQGKLGADDPVAQKIVQLLGAEIPIQMEGTTRFGEEVHHGIIGAIPDGSIDELLAAKKIFVDSKVVPGPATQTVIVVETPVIGVSLEKRIVAHEKVIRSYEELLSLRNEH